MRLKTLNQLTHRQARLLAVGLVGAAYLIVWLIYRAGLWLLK